MTEQNIQEQKETEIDLIALAKHIGRYKKRILKFALIGAFIGIVIAFSLPKEYEVITLIAPETKTQQGGSSMSGLAAMAGFNLGGMQANEGITKEIYPEVILSTPFLFEMANMPVETIDGKLTLSLVDYIGEQIEKPWWSYIPAIPSSIIGWFVPDEPKEKKEWNLFKPTGEQMGFAGILKSRIKMEADKKSGLLKITTRMQDPLVSAQVADSVLSKLSVYMINYKTKKTRTELEMSQKMLEEAKAEYNKTQLEYAQAVDRSQKVVTKTGKIKMTALENENTLAFSVYQQIASQVEIAKVKLAEETPIATVVEPAKVPLREVSPRKGIITIGVAFFAAFVCISIIVVNYLINNKTEEVEKNQN